MNPQPSNTTVNIFTGLFLFFFFYFFFNGKKQDMKNIDMMNLGVLYEPTSVSQPVEYKVNFISTKPTKTKKRTTQKKIKQPKPESEAVDIKTETKEEVVETVKPVEKQLTHIQLLAKDCYETLIAIGYKKREAKKLVIDYFATTPNPDIIQFIKDITFKA